MLKQTRSSEAVRYQGCLGLTAQMCTGQPRRAVMLCGLACVGSGGSWAGLSFWPTVRVGSWAGGGGEVVTYRKPLVVREETSNPAADLRAPRHAHET